MAMPMYRMPYPPKVQFHGQLPPLASVYRTLEREEFRLLQVHGYDNYGILRCSLQHTPFREEAIIPYAAISYTWNEADKLWYGDYDISPKPVRINEVVVLIPDKVANIICLAEQHSKKVIWIDAICINQTNLDEKSHQVAKMGTIYSGALEVLSFLGSPCRDTDELIDQINSISSLEDPIRKLSPKSRVALTNFYANDYWRRAWVFQEIAIARTIVVFCGSRVVSLDTIFRLWEHLGEAGRKDYRRLGIKSLRALRHSGPVFSRIWKHGLIDGSDPSKYAMKGLRNTFLDVLRESRRHNCCHDPRDLLYSRMAVASDARMLIPHVDYQMPVEELYKRFATNLILQTGSLDVIVFASSTALHLPTWVPDWTSLSTGWDTEVKHNALRESLALLRWRDVGLPKVSQCRSEIMVQGKVIKTLQQRDYYSGDSTFASLTHNAVQYPTSEIPTTGDILCSLRGCPLLAYLRPVEQHFIIVGRHWSAQNRLTIRHYGVIKVVQDQRNKTGAVHELKSIEDVQSKREEIFRIR